MYVTGLGQVFRSRMHASLPQECYYSCEVIITRTMQCLELFVSSDIIVIEISLLHCRNLLDTNQFFRLANEKFKKIVANLY